MENGRVVKDPFFIAMKWTLAKVDPLKDSLAKVIGGLGMVLFDMSVSRTRGSTQVRLAVGFPPCGEGEEERNVGLNDCARVHRAVVPRLDLALGVETDYSLEVSSPGIDRPIKDGNEMPLYVGRRIRVYVVDAWVPGLLKEASERGLVIEDENGLQSYTYDDIAKAKYIGG
ncbi:MAG: ribosome assembly cofactor RimP [Spirochaetaceae bacterium]|jgi:ribosome maturation factor RimP|nr:ribosome assembly cofactor RimP [Spirochaetaceae bacterium]